MFIWTKNGTVSKNIVRVGITLCWLYAGNPHGDASLMIGSVADRVVFYACMRTPGSYLHTCAQRTLLETSVPSVLFRCYCCRVRKEKLRASSSLAV